MSKGPEAQIQASIMDYLAARRIFAIRMNSGAVVSEYKGRTRMIRYGMKGMADVLAFHYLGDEKTPFDSGLNQVTPLWIEVKAPKGRTTPDQDAFAEMVQAEGHRYIVARSIEDVEAALQP